MYKAILTFHKPFLCKVEPNALEAIASSPHKLWSVNLLPPALSSPRCDMTVAQQCPSMVTGTKNLVPSSCLMKSFIKRLPSLSSMDFGQGKVRPAQQLETLSSYGWRAKDSFLTPPLNDTGVIWFIPHSTSACSSVSSGCGKGLVLCPSSQGTRLLKDPKPWSPRWYIFFHL